MPHDPKHVKDIFLEAAEQPDDAARAAYLERVCGGDAELRARVEALLRSHDLADSFLGTPAAVMPDPSHVQTAAFDPSGTGDGPANPDPDDGNDGLNFLQPSNRPDSLGRIGHYEVLQVLGKGGFGIVFRAFDDNLQRVVAVKVLAPAIAATSPARKRFLREARSSAAVRHDNVVQVYEVIEQPLPYLVMEFIPGETLKQKLDRTGPLDVTEVLRIGRQIAEGLAAAHASDLIHRDIKPGNILLEGGSHKAKITDFGLARAADDASMTQSGVIAGTPNFMAPEQALGQPIDERADLFSLGSVLYQMVSGRPPFRAPSTLAVLKRVAEEPPRPIPQIIPETPDWLCGIITKLQAKDPDKRFQSAREVVDLLADCESQLKANSKLKDYSRIPRGQARLSGRRKWVAAAVILLLPVIALAVTELADVTHLFRGQQAANNPLKNGDRPVAKGTKPTWQGWPADGPPPAVAPFDAAQAKKHQEAWAKYLGVPVEYKNSIGMKFRLIPPGEFLMGSTPEEIEAVLKVAADEERWRERIQSEAPRHRVRITKAFQIGVHEVTRGQFRAFVKATGYKTEAEQDGKGGYGFLDGWVQNPKFVWSGDSGFDTGPDDEHPVCQVTWNDARAFCAWLTKQKGVVYRLPTEAEWEYACRAGTMTRWHSGNDDRGLKDYAWSAFQGGRGTRPVGTRRSNAFGLGDMHGNLWEWCSDWHRGDFYRGSPAMDPVGPSSGTERVLRGGNWYDGASQSRSACRLEGHPSFRDYSIGFRVVLPVDALKEKLNDKPAPLPPYKNSIGMEFVRVPKGKAWLGGSKDKLGDEEVKISADFYLGKYEVTQEEWEKVMGENPSHFSRAFEGRDAVKDVSNTDLKRLPVESVSWDDCQAFVARLNQREKESGWVYRLPTAVEWEYACRGGPMSNKRDSGFDFYFTKPANTLLPEQANFNMTIQRTVKVGSYPPNRLGLFDMHGNVWEWCQDEEKDEDGKPRRVTRGGCWTTNSGFCQAAFHLTALPTDRNVLRGVRLARVPSGAAVDQANGT